MKWLKTRNDSIVFLKEIPILLINEFRESIIEEIKNGKRVCQFFGQKIDDNIKLFCVLCDDELSEILISSTIFDKNTKSYDSITKEFYSFNMFEREFYEEYGIEPLGHPFLKPVRFSYYRNNQELNIEKYKFFRIEDSDIHEVGVGPIHAGIIEPGHFRFSCYGEEIKNLEIQLGYQHRGVEKLFINNNNDFYRLKLAESIAGDTVIGHGSTFCRIMEKLKDITISNRSMAIRAIALELERIAMHLADLSALSNDVAYLTGSSVFGVLRTVVINTLLRMSGSRFGRGLLAIGGVNFDIDNELKKEIIDNLNYVLNMVELGSEVLFSSGSVLSRFENTGVVTNEEAKMFGLVGLAARASGLKLDVRSDHPYEIYLYYPYHKFNLDSGDVYARAYIRYLEIRQSMKYIFELIENLPDGELNKNNNKNKMSDSLVISLTEGWRGEISHVAITDNKGDICYYKIKDPSFNNWIGLSIAVQNHGISDFPLCNKSFNLSYCGFDL